MNQPEEKNPNKFILRNLKIIYEEPMPCFKVYVEDHFTWKVDIFGPPEGIYENGYFEARLKFPTDYPYSPPTFQFISEMFHPNIYKDGVVCISILHHPNEDDGNDASYRWKPNQTISVIDMLFNPNPDSPANVDAAKCFRKSEKEKDKQYDIEVRKRTELTYGKAKPADFVMPRTLSEYWNSKRKKSSNKESDSYLDISIEYEDDDEVFSDNSDEAKVNSRRPSTT